MTIHFLTIVRDGALFLPHQLFTFQALKVPWVWHIVQGTAAPKHCTAWCKEIPYELGDATAFCLEAKNHPNVRWYPRERWEGKIEMANRPLAMIDEPGLLWQVDADEIWTPAQIETMHSMFVKNPDKTAAWFWCRYFLGPGIMLSTRGSWGNDANRFWWRVWRYYPGQQFHLHEPPAFDRVENPFTHEETEAAGLVFDHYGYAFESQVAFKEQYYGYKGAVDGWRRLQANTQWPTKLKKFLPWVDDLAEATKL